MSDKKQTAVDFFLKEFNDILGKIETTPMQNLFMIEAFSKAKEMEKQQIIDAHSQGIIEAMTTSYLQECDIEPMSEQYYTETYKP